MNFFFWRNKKLIEALDAKEQEVSSIHAKNVKKIKQTRSKIDKLNVVLEQNNIVFQLAHVIGNTK